MVTAVNPTPIEDIKAELDTLRSKKEAERSTREKERAKKDWYGLVYCDNYGWCWIADFEDGKEKPICLGRTEEFIPYLRARSIDGENVISVLIASQEFRSEQKNQSCHSAMEIDQTSISTPPEKPNRATFSNDTQFLSLLDGLIAKGYGIPTIQRELGEKGYYVPYRTLGRWVSKRKTD